MTEYTQGRGQEIVSEVKNLLPGVPWEEWHMQPIPCGHGPLIHLPGKAWDAATKAAAWASMSRKTNLLQSLEADWEQSHLPITQEESPPITETSTDEHRNCREAGFCLCTGAGARIFQLRNVMLRLLKEQFKFKERKGKLLRGCGGTSGTSPCHLTDPLLRR